MRILRRLLLAIATTGAALAQRDPHVTYVYPAGGQRGATLEVTVAGRALAGPTNVYFSDAGISAKILDYSRPLTPRELADIREQMRGLQEKKAMLSRGRRRRDESSSTNTVTWTAADEKLLGELRKKIENANKPRNPDTAEPVTLEVAIAPDAGLGQHELRLKTTGGLSNPLIFEVGKLREVVEEADAPDSRARYGRTTSNQPLLSANENEMNVTIPAVLNGQIMPGGVDQYRFPARKGARLHMSVHARALIPYLANAVPGWFQATVAIFDSKGRELAYADDNQWDPDPVLDFEIPGDGEYVVAIKDSIYRGREDFIYRLTIDDSAELAEKVAESYASDLPKSAEAEPNDSIASAQKISAPGVISGRIDRPGDVDVFQFEGAAGAQIVAEVYARRIGSPLDSLITLTDSVGNEIARNDDFEDKSAGLVPQQIDSYLRAPLPASGSYFIHVTDTRRKGGADFAYTLRVSPPQPDFALRIVPSSINVRGGLSVPVTAYVIRKDGFTNEISLALKDAPRGFAIAGGRIPGNQDKIRFTLTAPANATAEPINLTIEGSAEIDGAKITRTATPADDMMQAFAYHHLVPARELKVCVLNSRARQTMIHVSPTNLRIAKGKTATVEVSLPARTNPGRFEFELNEPPEGVAIEKVTETESGAAIAFAAKAASADSKGNLIVNIVTARRADNSTNKPAIVGNQRAVIGSLPAIPFEIVEN